MRNDVVGVGKYLMPFDFDSKRRVSVKVEAGKQVASKSRRPLTLRADHSIDAPAGQMLIRQTRAHRHA